MEEIWTMEGVLVLRDDCFLDLLERWLLLLLLDDDGFLDLDDDDGVARTRRLG